MPQDESDIERQRSANRWILGKAGRSLPSARLFCLPPAGASGAFYSKWRQLLPETVDVCPIMPPGRMGRADEPAFTDMEPFVTALADALTDLVDLPYCVFGYSLGGLVGFELCRELERRGMREPAVLIVAGCAAPHMVHHESHVAELDDRQLIELMNDRYAQIPAVLLEDPELRSQIVGAMRGDLTVFERYRYSQGARLNCQLTTLGGSSDPFCRTEQLAAWAELTSGPCLSRVFDGGHFFMHDHWSAVAELVAGELEQVARAG